MTREAARLLTNRATASGDPAYLCEKVRSLEDEKAKLKGELITLKATID